LYELQETHSLALPDWHAVQSYIGGFPGTGETVIDFNPPGERRGYYRIKATGPIRP
jgi:hypothetical protein